jgi:hypothetical protein
MPHRIRDITVLMWYSSVKTLVTYYYSFNLCISFRLLVKMTEPADVNSPPKNCPTCSSKAFRSSLSAALKFQDIDIDNDERFGLVRY